MDMQADNSLKDVLQQFEQRLETPVVPGELVEWIREAVEACDRLGPALDRQRRDTHEEMLARIEREDDELLQRVQLLREEDEQLRSDYEQLRVQAQRLDRQAEAAEPHERRLDDQMSSFVQRGLELVIRVRKQEAALDTWFVESFDRDRGVAD